MRKTIQAIFFSLTLIGMMPMEGGCCTPKKCKSKNNCFCKALRNLPVRKPPRPPTGFPPLEPPTGFPPLEPPVGILVAYVDNMSLTAEEDGSPDFPYATIEDAVASGADIICIKPNPKPYTVATTITLLPKQVLVGSELPLNGKKEIQLSLEKPVLSIGAQIGIVMADASLLANCAILGNGSLGQKGVVARGATSCSIRNNAFSTFDTAIALDSSSSGNKADVIGNTFANISLYGISSGPPDKESSPVGNRSTSPYELFIEGNAFINAEMMGTAIVAVGVGKLIVIDNTSSYFESGLAAGVVSPGASLEVRGNRFTEMFVGNLIDTYQTILFSENLFACDRTLANQVSLGILVSEGTTASILDNTFEGSLGYGFRIGAVSPNAPFASLHLVGNDSSDNGAGFNLNPSDSSPLQINGDYGDEGVNFGSKIHGNLILLPVGVSSFK